MKEFSNLISVYPISELGQTIDPLSNPLIIPHTFMADTFTFDPQSEIQDPGLLYKCDLTFIIDTPNQSEINTFKTPTSSIMVLRDTDGTNYSLGTKTIPGTVHIQRHLQKSRLIFKCNSLSNPF